MSAHPVHVRVITVSGIAVCEVCGRWSSFERPCEEAELERIRCAVCGAAGVELWRGTLWAILELKEGV